MTIKIGFEMMDEWIFDRPKIVQKKMTNKIIPHPMWIKMLMSMISSTYETLKLATTSSLPDLHSTHPSEEKSKTSGSMTRNMSQPLPVKPQLTTYATISKCLPVSSIICQRPLSSKKTGQDLLPTANVEVLKCNYQINDLLFISFLFSLGCLQKVKEDITIRKDTQLKKRIRQYNLTKSQREKNKRDTKKLTESLHFGLPEWLKQSSENQKDRSYQQKSKWNIVRDIVMKNKKNLHFDNLLLTKFNDLCMITGQYCFDKQKHYQYLITRLQLKYILMKQLTQQHFIDGTLLEQLLQFCFLQRFSAQSLVYSQHEPREHIYIVLSGKCTLFTNKESVILQQHKSNSFASYGGKKDHSKNLIQLFLQNVYSKKHILSSAQRLRNLTLKTSGQTIVFKKMSELLIKEIEDICDISLPSDEKQQIARVIEYQRYTNGEYVYYQNTAAKHLHFIVEGNVMLSKEIVVEHKNKYPICFDTWEVKKFIRSYHVSVDTLDCKKKKYFGMECIIYCFSQKSICISPELLLLSIDIFHLLKYFPPRFANVFLRNELSSLWITTNNVIDLFKFKIKTGSKKYKRTSRPNKVNKADLLDICMTSHNIFDNAMIKHINSKFRSRNPRDYDRIIAKSLPFNNTGQNTFINKYSMNKKLVIFHATNCFHITQIFKVKKSNFLQDSFHLH
ncbi:hypothetical protein RFI_21582 [Reticulomyxa filosa]|uniref:Cyclic nucleotide-binding domain-containing protein n=1 Tax=Reticulomyxa filosa TaxID=46433 RepID=X6MRQ9_RETFI|nr:hypothetical protein RFI_21582 [Reticulomyxa filosa]|eukprot:ETO15785.1 hypothetical protein RFI_21582 [Reticulomyxa filosa]